MADGSKIPHLIAEDSESTPLIVDYSSNDELTELDVQQYESSTTKCDTGSVASAAIGDDVNIEKAGNSGDSDDQKELICEVKETEIALREVQGDTLQPIILECPRSNPPRDYRDLASAAACASRLAAITCRSVIYATCDAITETKVRVDKALQKAEGAASDRYRALANRYDAALRLAARRARQVHAVAEIAEISAKKAITVADQIAQSPNEDSNELERIYVSHWAANTANIAAIVAYKTEYVAMKAIRKCLENIDFGNESRGYPTRNRGITRCCGEKWGKIIGYFLVTVLFILGICIFAAVLPSIMNPEHRTSLVTLRGIFLAVPVCVFINLIVCYIFKRRQTNRLGNGNVIAKIDDRLRELHNYFVNNNITTINSDEEQ